MSLMLRKPRIKVKPQEKDIPRKDENKRITGEKQGSWRIVKKVRKEWSLKTGRKCRRLFKKGMREIGEANVHGVGTKKNITNSSNGDYYSKKTRNKCSRNGE